MQRDRRRKRPTCLTELTITNLPQKSSEKSCCTGPQKEAFLHFAEAPKF